MIPENEILDAYNQILQLGGLGVGVLAVTVILLMVGLGFVIVRMQTRAQTADSETTQQIVLTFGGLISKLNTTMEGLREDMAKRNTVQQEQSEILRSQTETQKLQLEQLVVIGKNQSSWHTVIDTDLNDVREHMLMLSNRIGNLEDTIDALARFIKDAPESSDKDDIIISMLQAIADRLEKLNSKFDTQEVEAVTDGSEERPAA